MELTQFDKQLLNLVQTGLPLTPAPFADLADRLGCPEQQVLEQLARLRDEGIIVRRVASYGLPACLRITVGDEASCRRVAHVIGRFMAGREQA